MTADFAFPAGALALIMPIWVSGRRGWSCQRRIGGESDHVDPALVPVECDDAAMKTPLWVDPTVLVTILSGPSADRLPGRFSAETCITPGRSCEKFSQSSEPESAATSSPAPGSACETSSWSRRENRLPRNYLGAEAPFRHLELTTTAWPLRASRDTPALLARLV
jgi:hypothetical protein